VDVAVSAFIRFLKDGSVAPRTEHDEGLDRLAVLTWRVVESEKCGTISRTSTARQPELDIAGCLDEPCIGSTQRAPPPLWLQIQSESEDRAAFASCTVEGAVTCAQEIVLLS
jgi:hypothetical protein